MTDTARVKVASGEYATESEVIREGLRSLIARDRSIETWLREQIVPEAITLEADPSRALTADQARERLAQKRRECARRRFPRSRNNFRIEVP